MRRMWCWTRLALTASALSGCALSARMPMIGPGLQRTERPLESLPGSSPAVGTHAVGTEFDSVDDVSRFSVVTHPGRYFLWIQRPRVTFFVVNAGRTMTATDVVYLVFRTQTPQELNSSRLAMTCDGNTTEEGGVPTAQVAQGMLTTSVFQTFSLPAEVFRHFARCGSAAISVGGISAPFEAANLDSLRAFAAALPQR